jgi:hypothetical protein
MIKQTIILSLLGIIIFTIIAIIVKYILLPLFPSNLQTDLALFGGSLVTTITITAAIAQLTGFNLKDFFTRNKNKSTRAGIESNPANEGIVITAKEHGQLQINRDILQKGSTKIVIGQSELEEDHKSFPITKIEILIKDIQSKLYGDITQLPYVLTLSLDLCNQLQMGEDYNKWLLMELGGIENYQHFKDEFKSDRLFETWMDKWASHRFIPTHIKFAYRAAESGRYAIDELKYKEIFVAFPVSKIIRDIQMIKDSPSQEYSIELRTLGGDYFIELKKIVKETLQINEIPSDLKVFYNVSALEKILDEVRKKILLLISDARKKMQ